MQFNTLLKEKLYNTECSCKLSYSSDNHRIKSQIEKNQLMLINKHIITTIKIFFFSFVFNNTSVMISRSNIVTYYVMIIKLTY